MAGEVVRTVAIRYASVGASTVQQDYNRVQTGLTRTGNVAKRSTDATNRWMKANKTAMLAVAGVTAGFMATLLAASPTANAILGGLRGAFGLLAESIIQAFLGPKGAGVIIEWGFKVVEAFTALSPAMKSFIAIAIVTAGAVGILTAAVFAFGVVINTVGWPILIIVAALAALAAGVSLLVMAWRGNWFGIRDVVIGAIDAIRPMLEQFMPRIQAIWMKVLLILKAFWAQWGDEIMAVVAFFTTYVLNHMAGMFDTLLTVLEVFLAVMTGDWEGAWDAIRGYMIRTTQRIMNVFWAFKGAFDAVWQAIVDVGTAMAQAVAGIILTVRNTVQGFIDSATQWGRDLLTNFLAGLKTMRGRIKKFFEDLLAPITFDIAANDRMAQRWGSDLAKHFSKGVNTLTLANGGTQGVASPIGSPMASGGVTQSRTSIVIERGAFTFTGSESANDPFAQEALVEQVARALDSRFKQRGV